MPYLSYLIRPKAYVRYRELTIIGIDDRLAGKLTQNIPADVLRAFVELYCNIWALEDRIFTLKSPWSFFTMFGNPGGAISADMAVEAFEDDVKFTSRSVRPLPLAQHLI